MHPCSEGDGLENSRKEKPINKKALPKKGVQMLD